MTWPNIVVGVVWVTLMAVLTQVTMQMTQPGEDVIEVEMGGSGRIEDAEIKVTQIQLTSAIEDEMGAQNPCGESCAFLVATVEVTDHGRTNLPLTTSLEYAGLEAQPTSSVIGQQAGYAITSTVPIAVDPSRLEGARFSVWPLEDLEVYPRRVTFDLGIDRVELQRLAAEAPPSIEVPVSPTRRPL
ncbi:hypothetical protein GCM10009702_10840 [Propioniferax innocua]